MLTSCVHARHDRSTCKRHEPPASVSRTVLEYESSVEGGFQIATLQGPLCAEPVQGMAYLVESLKATETDGQDTEGASSHLNLGLNADYLIYSSF
jgi:ribosome assembly protein 1